MKSLIKTTGLVFLLAALALGGSRSAEQTIREKVQDMFRAVYGVKASQIHITWRRLPDLSVYNSGYRTDVRLQNHKMKLGYQTLWVDLLKKGRLVKRVPVSLEISIDRQVVVASQKIKRHQRITSEMVTQAVRRISSDWSGLVVSKQDVIGREAKRMIRAGAVISKDLFRPVPVIHRGDLIKLQVKSSGLTLTTLAYAKEEGNTGETVLVETKQSGKKLKAKILGPGLVVILQEKTI